MKTKINYFNYKFIAFSILFVIVLFTVLTASCAKKKAPQVQEAMVYSAQRVYYLSGKRYSNGIDSYLSVLDAQRSLYSAQKELITMQLSKLVNEVRAYAVLGGGVLDESKPRKKENLGPRKKTLFTADSKQKKSKR
jgi:hypothetical protein